MSGVSGDFGALAEMVKKIEAAAGADGQFRTGLLTQCAEGARHALDESFITSTDPYGNPWKPLVLRAGGKPLLDTGRLASSYTYHVTAMGFVVETNVDYAATHQYGATIVPVVAKSLAWQVRGSKRWYRSQKSVIPKRQMVPQQDTGGMGAWGPAINEEADEFVRAWFK